MAETFANDVESDEELGFRSRPRVCWSGMLRSLTGRLACIADIGVEKLVALSSEKVVETVEEEKPLFLRDPPETVAIEALYAFRLFAKFQKDFPQLGGLSVLGLRELCTQLAMDISVVDLDRLHALANVSKTGSITLAEFTNAASKVPFFQNLLAAMSASRSFSVGREYDYSRSTIENYNSVEGNLVAENGDSDTLSNELNEEVQSARTVLSLKLDTFTFGTARKQWQDSMVLRTCLGVDLQPESSPTLLISIAAQVALPLDVITWMSKSGFCQQRNLVKVKRSDMMHCMPELPLYIRRHGTKNALSFVRAEAQVMEALTVEVAMARKRHIWLDCEVADVGDLVQILPGLRARHPEYRVHLLDVRVDEELVHSRHRRILRSTGRDLAENAIYSQDKFDSLIACSDIHARIDNSENQPVLQQIHTIDKSGCWGALAQHISGRLRTTSEIASFPHMLPPLRLERVTVTSSLLDGYASSLGHSCTLTLNVGFCGSAFSCHGSAQKLASALQKVGTNTDALPLHTSPTHRVPPGGHDAMLIELGKKVESCAWLYGHRDTREACNNDALSQDALMKLGVDPHCIIARLLRRGGFVQFGDKTEGHKALFLDMPTDAPCATYLQFAPPQRLGLAAANALADRWQLVTDERLRREGATKECWIVPGEQLTGFRAPDGGGFAYTLDDQAAAIIGSSAVFYRILM